MKLENLIRSELHLPEYAISDEELVRLVDRARESLMSERVLVNLVKLYITDNMGDTKERNYFKKVILGKLEIKG